MTEDLIFLALVFLIDAFILTAILGVCAWCVDRWERRRMDAALMMDTERARADRAVLDRINERLAAGTPITEIQVTGEEDLALLRCGVRLWELKFATTGDPKDIWG